ncbi:hypothetical protein MTO96_048087 [Rhipicephalus appendiculatus]
MQPASSARRAQSGVASPDAASPPAAPSTARGAPRAPRRDGEGLRSILADAGSRRKVDVTKTTRFSPSAEASQIAQEEEEEPKKNKAPAACPGIAALLFTPVNAIASRFKGGRRDSLEVMRKRRAQKDEESRPFPVMPCLAACLTAALIGGLTIYALTNSSPSEASTASTAKTSSKQNALDDDRDEEAHQLDEPHRRARDFDEASSEPLTGEPPEDTDVDSTDDAAGDAAGANTVP